MHFIDAKHFFDANRNPEFGGTYGDFESFAKNTSKTLKNVKKSSNLSFIRILIATSESFILEVLIVQMNLRCSEAASWELVSLQGVRMEGEAGKIKSYTLSGLLFSCIKFTLSVASAHICQNVIQDTAASISLSESHTQNILLSSIQVVR